MGDNLVKRLNIYKGTWVDVDYLEDLFKEYGWAEMGFNNDMSKLIYIESPMGKEIDLEVEIIDKGVTLVKIKNIIKKYWND